MCIYSKEKSRINNKKENKKLKKTTERMIAHGRKKT